MRNRCVALAVLGTLGMLCQATALGQPARPPAPAAPKIAKPPPTTQPVTQRRGPAGPTLAEVYGKYAPDFLEADRINRNDPHKLSLQQWFYNMTQVEHDFRVDALVKKADEYFAAKDWRNAIKLYQEVINNFPDDLWRIEANGIFVPTTLYCQRRLLQMPDDQILYYRTLRDPEAEQMFVRAKKYYSLLDFAEIAERYLATSYGDDALWELGNGFLDQGNYAKALYYYQQIRDYCTLSDIPADALALRLATCFKHLGMEGDYEQSRDQYTRSSNGKAAGGASGSADKSPPTGPFLKQLGSVAQTAAPFYRQARSPDSIALSDYALYPDLLVPADRKQFVWSEEQPNPGFQWYVRDLPWICGNYIYTLHHNVLLCRSLLTGKLNWSFGPGGLVDWFDLTGLRHEPWGAFGGAISPNFHPENDMLIHDGLVFASILKDGPSLVAVDRVTGQLRWAKGAITASEGVERNMRYLAAPAAGPNVIYAPYVFDDIEGKAHLTSTAGINCFDSRTGRLIWTRAICQLTPPKFSTSFRVRRIRVYGTSPTVRDGVIYHTTDAGMIVALDALSGTVLWATRYPHTADTHDLLKPHDRMWFPRPPLLDGDRLIVAPPDCERLLCLSASTGKVLWSIPRGVMQTVVGIAADGTLVLTGSGLNNQLAAIDPKTGLNVWRRDATPPDTTSPMGAASTICRPILTEGGKLYFIGVSYGGVFSEQYYDLKAKKTLTQRWWYHATPLSKYNEEIRREAAARGVEPDNSKFLANNTDLFTSYHRMSFRRFGTQFELEVSPQRISVWYDREAVESATAKDASPQGLFNQAELREIVGDRKGAIELYTRALSALPVWPTPFRTEINRQLFRLYNRQAEAALRAADLPLAEQFCRQMASACTTSDDEIHTIMAMAEVFQRQSRWSDSAACLSAAIRHYRDVKIALPGILAGDTDALRAKGLALLANLRGKAPRKFYPGQFDLAVKAFETGLDDYFSVISPLAPEVDVQTGQFATRWLQKLGRVAPESFRQERETLARAALESESDESVILKLIGEYPGAAAAQKALDRLIERAAKLPEPDRRIMLWRLNDCGRLNGLAVPESVRQTCQIRVTEPPPAPLAGGYDQATTTLTYDVNTLLVALTPAGEKASNAPLGFLGMRSKRRYANKFGLACWDLAANKKKWEVAEIRLKDKGEEEGFTKYYIHDDHVVVHGWYDVLAFSLAEGKPVWRFQVPYGFRIMDSAMAEDVMVLSDNTRSLAIHLRTGQLIWEANETGGVYSPPILRDNLLVTVRRNPSGVVFRDLGTGRLLGHLQMSSLCESVRNPAVTWEEQGVPLVHCGGSLVITDGFDFTCVDMDQRKIRWQKRIADIDRLGQDDASFRFWANDKTLVVLKPVYDSVGMEAIDLATGKTLWAFSEDKTPGVLFSAVMGPDSICGLHASRDDRGGIFLVGYSLANGKKLFRQGKRDYETPDFWLPGPQRGQYVVVNVSNEQMRTLLLADAATGKVAQTIELKGFGQWGGYGEVSYVTQGRYMMVLSDKDLTVLKPGK